MIKVKFDFLGEPYEVELRKGEYGNGRLAVRAIDLVEFEPFSPVTVNLPEEILWDGDCAFIDTNNCPAELVAALKEEGIITETDFMGYSGYCAYPEVKFSKLEEMEAL